MRTVTKALIVYETLNTLIGAPAYAGEKTNNQLNAKTLTAYLRELQKLHGIGPQSILKWHDGKHKYGLSAAEVGGRPAGEYALILTKQDASGNTYYNIVDVPPLGELGTGEIHYKPQWNGKLLRESSVPSSMRQQIQKDYGSQLGNALKRVPNSFFQSHKKTIPKTGKQRNR